MQPLTTKTCKILSCLSLLIPLTFPTSANTSNITITKLKPKYEKTNLPNNITNLDITQITNITGQLAGGWIKPAQSFNLIKIANNRYLAQIQDDGYKKGIYFEVANDYVMSLSAHYCQLSNCANRDLTPFDPSVPVALNDYVSGYRIKDMMIEFNDPNNTINTTNTNNTTGTKGEKGDKGEQGIQGEKGEQGIQGERGLQGSQGLKGDQGIQGEKGERGVQGLKGDKGDTGDQGIAGKDGKDGIDGIDGDSAYQIWLDQGNIGSKEDFIASLKGDNHWELSGGLLKYKDNLIVNSNSGNTNIKTKLTVGSAFIQSNAQLGVQGNAEITGHIRVGNSDSSCSSANEGAIRYNSTTKTMEFCNSNDWISFINNQNLNYPIYGCDDFVCQLGSANSYGGWHTCALKLDNTVQCWGSNNSGQGTVPEGLNAKQIALGDWHTCALKLDNTVQCWGLNDNGQIDIPSEFKAKQIALGSVHTCALKLDNTVQCWGSDGGGQSTVPAELKAKQIALGAYHTCALKLDNTVQCWGSNDSGQRTVPEGLNAKQIALGNYHSCALKLDNTVQCWGYNNHEQRTVPNDLTAKQLALGVEATCALKLDNTVQCWGWNGFKQIDVPSGLTAKQIGFGWAHACALKLDNTVQCWGNDGAGQSTVPSGLTAGQL